MALAFLLRVWGLDFGLPNLSRPDEQNIADAVFRILGSFAEGKPSLNPHFFYYPSLYLYLVSLLYGVYYLLGHLSGQFPNFQAFHALYLDDWSSFFLISRALSAVFGTATVWALYRLAHTASQSRVVGLVAALLLAITYLHVRDSHFGVTDIVATFLVVAALWRTVAFYQGRQPKSLYQAALLAGLAASTKYPCGLAAVPVLLAFYFDLRDRGHTLPDLWRRPSVLKQTLELLGIIFGAFFLASPFILLDFPGFLEHFLSQSQLQHSAIVLDLGKGWIRHLNFSLWHGLGGLYLLFALAAMLVLTLQQKNQRRLHGLLLGFAGLFYLLIGNSHVVFVRYIIPILPILALYSAWGLVALTSRTPLQAPWSRRALLGVLTLLITGPSLWASLQFDRLAAKPDTRTLAAQWLSRHLSPGDAVGVGASLNQVELSAQFRKYRLPNPLAESHSLPGQQPGGKAHYTPAPLNQRNEFLIDTFTDVSTLQALKIRYIAVCISPLEVYNPPLQELTALDHDPRLRQVERFEPGLSHTKDYDQIDAFYLPFTGLAGVTRPGPEIRIYEVLN